MGKHDEGTGKSQAPDPGASAVGRTNNEIDTISLPPPPPRPGKFNNNNKSNRSLSNDSQTGPACTASKSKSSHSWLDTLADIRDNLLAADTVSLDGSRHGSRDFVTASPRTVPDSPTSFRFSPSSFQIIPAALAPASGAATQPPSTEAELIAEWRNKYHQLAQKNAEVEADLLSQLSALSSALYEKTREQEMFKKSSDKTTASLKTQVETQQVTLDARVKDLESIQVIVEAQKNTVARLQRQLDTLVSDNNFTLEDTTRVEIDRLQAKERENYARLVAFERENKFLMNQAEKSKTEKYEMLEELNSYKAMLEGLYQCQRELEDTKQKLQKVTASHASDKNLLQEEQQKYEELIRQTSQQQNEFMLHEDKNIQKISALSSDKAKLESYWMAKCDEVQQKCRNAMEDMEYQVETKCEELYIAKEIAAELEQKLFVLTAQLESTSREYEERDRQLEQLLSEEKERTSAEFHQKKAAINELQSALKVLEGLQGEKDDRHLKLEAKLGDLQEIIQVMKQEHTKLLEEKELQLTELQHHTRLLEEEILNQKAAAETIRIELAASQDLVELLNKKVSTLTLELSTLISEHNERIRTYKENVDQSKLELHEVRSANEIITKSLQRDLEQSQEKLDLATANVADLEVKFEAFKLEHDKLCDEKESQMSFFKERIVLLEQDVLKQKAEAEKARNAKVGEFTAAQDTLVTELKSKVSSLTLQMTSLISDHEERVQKYEQEVKELECLLEKNVNDNNEIMAALQKELEEKFAAEVHLTQEASKYKLMLAQTNNENNEVVESLKQSLKNNNEKLLLATQQIVELEAGIQSLQLGREKMAGEKESELALVNQRVVELEQDVTRFKSQVAMLEEALESKHMEADDTAKTLISALQKEKTDAIVSLEEKDRQLLRVSTEVATLRHEIDELHTRLENESVNDEMILSLRLELNEAKDDYESELLKYKKEVEDLQQQLHDLNGFHEEEKVIFLESLSEKSKLLSIAENKNIDLAKVVASIESELDQMHIEKGKLIASGENPLDQFQRDSCLQDMRLKLVDRDQTINGLLKAAAAQEEKLGAIEAEKEKFLEPFNIHDIAVKEEEMKQLKAILDQSRRNEAALENELQQLREQANSFNESYQDVTDWQARLDELRTTVDMLEKEKASLVYPLTQSGSCDDKLVIDLKSKLQEKEVIIANLSKTLLDYDQQLSLQPNICPPDTRTTLDESFQKLQDENEMFACQIIEQEEELELLKSKLAQKNLCNQRLESDVHELRIKLQESAIINSPEPNEIERLKPIRNMGDGEEMHICVLESQIEDLQVTLASLQRENLSLRDQIQQQAEAKFQRDVASVVHGTSDSDKQNLLKSLAEKELTVLNITEVVRCKDIKISELEQELQATRQNVLERRLVVSNPSENELFSSNSRNREREIADLAHKNQILTKQAKQVAELSRKLEESENGRLLFEKSNFEAFEQKLALIKSNKDAALDSLRKEVASLKASKKEIEIDFMNQITALESTRNGSKSEAERKLKAKDEVISRLEQKVASQEQLFNNMSLEMDQLRGSMSKVNLSRRDEVEEMQQEIMDSSAKLKQKEREIAALKMKLDEEKLQHADDIARIRNQLATRGMESVTAKGAREIRDEMEITELNETIQQLKRRNNNLSEENSKLCAKLESMEPEKKTTGYTDKSRTSALKEQVKTLVLRVQELEGRHKELRTTGTYEWAF